MHNSYIDDLSQEYIAYSHYINEFKATAGINVSSYNDLGLSHRISAGYKF